MAKTIKIDSLATKDDERAALAKIAEAVKAVDSQSYLARFFSDEALAWFNRQVADDMNTDLAEENGFHLSQWATAKSLVATVEQRELASDERNRKAIETLKAEAAQAEGRYQRTAAYYRQELEEKRAALVAKQERLVAVLNDLQQTQVELATVKAQIRAQTMKAQAALGALAALVAGE